MSQSTSRIIRGARLAVWIVLGATALAVAPAWATVTQWHYDASRSFSTGDTVFSSGSCNTTNTTTKLAWGCPSGPRDQQSSLVIDPTSATGVSVNTWIGTGTPPPAYISVPGVVLTHNNFVISEDSKELLSGRLDTTVTLTPWAPPPPGSAFSPEVLSFAFSFSETDNAAPCADATYIRECPDILVFAQNTLNHSFMYDGQEYFLSVFPVNGGTANFLSAAECAAAGAPVGCFGFTTEEREINALHFGLAISTERIFVPEPDALGMMGLGLLAIVGIAIVRRRRSSATSRN